MDRTDIPWQKRRKWMSTYPKCSLGVMSVLNKKRTLPYWEFWPQLWSLRTAFKKFHMQKNDKQNIVPQFSGESWSTEAKICQTAIQQTSNETQISCSVNLLFNVFKGFWAGPSAVLKADKGYVNIKSSPDPYANPKSSWHPFPCFWGPPRVPGAQRGVSYLPVGRKANHSCDGV